MTLKPQRQTQTGALIAVVVAAAANGLSPRGSSVAQSASELPAEDSSEVDANTQLRTKETQP